MIATDDGPSETAATPIATAGRRDAAAVQQCGCGQGSRDDAANVDDGRESTAGFEEGHDWAFAWVRLVESVVICWKKRHLRLQTPLEHSTKRSPGEAVTCLSKKLLALNKTSPQLEISALQERSATMSGNDITTNAGSIETWFVRARCLQHQQKSGSHNRTGPSPFLSRQHDCFTRSIVLGLE